MAARANEAHNNQFQVRMRYGPAIQMADMGMAHLAPFLRGGRIAQITSSEGRGGPI